MPCNNGKDCRYIVGYQVDEALIPLFIKTPRDIFSYGMSQCNKKSAYTMSFNVSDKKECVSQYKKIWNEVESQLFKNGDRIDKRRRQVRQWQVENVERTHKNKSSWSGCSMYCSATAMLKVDC